MRIRMSIHVYRPNSLIFRLSEGNNFSTPNDILINLNMHHHTIAIYKFHENPSIAC